MTHPIKPDGEERRVITIGGLEVRALEGAAPVLAGYAAVFGELSEDLGGFREKIASGAFAKSLGGDVRALFNHDPNLILGRTKSKTLVLAEDNKGLRVEITPPDTEFGRGVVEAVRRGDVDQMSFGFRTKKDKWEDGENNTLVRTLIEVDIFDVSPVVFPAYPTTEIGVRSMEAYKATLTPPASPDYSEELRRLDLMALE